MTKKALNRAGVDYRDIDVTTDEQALNHIKALGYQAVPVIEANGEHWFGYDPEKLASLK
jgi:glutaredoxin-like protein NrdH